MPIEGDDWSGGAALPNWARASNQPKKPTGFVRDLSPSWEAEKRDREVAEQGIAVVLQSEPLWKPNDSRWLVPESEYGWVLYVLKWGGPCVYCTGRVEADERGLYSRRINSVAHIACEGSGRFVRASDRLGDSNTFSLTGRRLAK